MTKVFNFSVGAALGGAVATVVAVGGVAASAAAATPGDWLDPAFATHAASAAAKEFPSARAAQRSETATSAADEAHTLRLSDVGLNVDGSTVVLERRVGAQAPVSAASLGNAAQTHAAVLHRGKTTLTAYARSTAYGTSITWTERAGLGYSISARNGVTPARLTAIAEALPADASTVSPQTLDVIKTLRPAVADVSPDSAGSLVVDGVGDTHDDIRDEATLSNGGSYWHSNYAALWQGMLWSEGLMTQSDVDCQFGPHTAAQTSAYQSRYGLAVNGRLDDPTRRLVETWIDVASTAGDGSTYVHYLGTNGNYILIHRQTSALSYRYDVNLFNEWHGAWYTSASYTFC